MSQSSNGENARNPATRLIVPLIQSAYVQPQLPMVYDLSSDPHEDSNLWYTRSNYGLDVCEDFKLMEEYERSVREYPNIKVVEDFKGYKK